ncbi:unnamed protein product [Protopolystoma xenopodis]|uniref:Uncharacterized protein n=1 Tax=Protopolystoma xenopodis TaxID=117903 RepID=A0A448XDI7_9PLAT|nr:unnamed protein product [Protopolystoma xenopodis]
MQEWLVQRQQRPDMRWPNAIATDTMIMSLLEDSKSFLTVKKSTNLIQPEILFQVASFSLDARPVSHPAHLRIELMPLQDAFRVLETSSGLLPRSKVEEPEFTEPERWSGFCLLLLA